MSLPTLASFGTRIPDGVMDKSAIGRKVRRPERQSLPGRLGWRRSTVGPSPSSPSPTHACGLRAATIPAAGVAVDATQIAAVAGVERNALQLGFVDLVEGRFDGGSAEQNRSDDRIDIVGRIRYIVDGAKRDE